MPLPATAYTSAAAHAEDLALLGNTWLFAAHSSRLPSPTGALALTVAGQPLLIVQRPDGQVGAFHNICRHRAGPLVWEGEAEACRVLRCRYHGWQYALGDGALLRTPDFGEVDVASLPLVPVAATTWRGLVFINLAPQPRPLQLGPLPELAAHLALEELTLQRIERHELRANWKTYAENYLEGLHIPFLHPTLAREVALQDYRVEVHPHLAVHRVPTKAGAPSTGLWLYRWPTLALNTYAGGLSLERLEPTGPGTMVLEYTYLFAPDTSPEDREAAIAASTRLTHEDARIVEAVQRNLQTGRVDPAVLSPRHEGAVAAFQAWRQQALGHEQDSA